VPGGIVTVSGEVWIIPLSEAVTVVEPETTAVSSPVELIVATAVFAVAQLVVVVTFAVEPSLYVAVTVNCSVVPATTLAMLGDTVTAVTTFAATLRVAVPLTPPSDAVSVVEPAATPVARPAELIVATAEVATVQLADGVTFAVEPSLYVAVAVN
jgi:hypothetical protein